MAASASGKIEEWASGTTYTANQAVYVSSGALGAAGYENKLYKCLVGHVANTFVSDFGNSYWQVVNTAGPAGPAGDAGAKGETGATGATGAAGANGADGSDGIFSVIANQAEAEAGTNNTKGMTPLRVSQAITALVNTLSAAQIAQIATNNTNAQAALGRIAAIEAAVSVTVKMGQQVITNNQATATSLEGKDASGGYGNALSMTNAEGRAAVIEFEIYRKDDAETRLSLVTAKMVFNPDTLTWYLGRVSTVDLIDGNPDGVTLSVTTTGPNALGYYTAQVKYVSDNMAGGNYSSNSYIKYRVQRLPVVV